MDAWTLVQTIFSHMLVKAVVGLMAGNVLIGIAKALYLRDFRLGDLGDWLLSRAIPYLLGAGSVQLVLMTTPQEWSGVAQGAGTAVWLFVCASLVGKILGSLADMGMPVPAFLTDTPKHQAEATP